jgi:hypothetical protein
MINLYSSKKNRGFLSIIAEMVFPFIFNKLSISGQPAHNDIQIPHWDFAFVMS